MLSLKTTNNRTTNSQHSQQPTRHNMLEPCTGSTPKKRIIAIARRRIFFGFLGFLVSCPPVSCAVEKDWPKEMSSGRRFGGYTPPETNIAPENWWLEYVGILLSFWEGLFSGAMLVLGRGI